MEACAWAEMRKAAPNKTAIVCGNLSLPGVNGFLLLRTIRANVETALLPVFVVTGSVNPKDESGAQRPGATSFISKDRLALPLFRATIAQLLSSANKKSETSVATDHMNTRAENLV